MAPARVLPASGAFLLPWAESVLDGALRRSGLIDPRTYEIFGQGSRVNNTFIDEASDIDLVLMLRSPVASPGGWTGFRDEVMAALGESFVVRMGRRCLNVDNPDSLFGEMVDILVATDFRRYTGDRYEQGVYFLDREGRPIVNFPKQHRRNGDAKDLRTGGRFKEAVRTAKRARRGADFFAEGIAPSYLIECLLYNVPDEVYLRGSYQEAWEWLGRCWREDPVGFGALPCQNGINRLFGPGPDQWDAGAAGRIIDVLHQI
ncbi:hypothetical protein [Actinoplanes palleronii]|uniref:Nucleotidyltransferase n=1 Tax=Actinoplanes palleronii TaxID=113570 RepID=A0ABQ4BHA5_9ACTN|nr:hypothetical protein [Actinoplanes palleronii]GIE70037.1 nucleotidyltransferase [Actinoplanes palleronii]